MRVAVVDLGTNTCRLLLAEVEAGRIIGEAARETTIVRLGQAVDAHGRLHAAATRRARARLADYAARIDAYGPERRLLIATSGLRDAQDGLEFLRDIQRDLGLPFRLISGEVEGRLAFRGAVCGAAGLSGTVLVVDIGGGSTELVVGPPGCEAEGGPPFVRSIEVGAVRLTERFLHTDPPTDAELEAAVAFTRRALDEAVPTGLRRRAGVGLGVAGTITTLVMHERGLRKYRRELVDGRVLSLAAIEAAIAEFRPLRSAERGRLAGIEPGREDVILAGALIVREVCLLFGLVGLRCVEADVLEGAALMLAEMQPPQHGPQA